MKYAKTYALVLILVFISCQSQPTGEQGASVEFLSSDSSADLPFSEAVRVGDWLFLSGQIGINPENWSSSPWWYQSRNKTDNGEY